MLMHLKQIEERLPNGWTRFTHTDPNDPANWIDDPCTFCGGESFPAQCPGDSRVHHHGAIHLPDDRSGYGYLCRSPECRAKAEQMWQDYRQIEKVTR